MVSPYRNATQVIKGFEDAFTKLNRMAFDAKVAYLAMDENVLGGKGLLVHEYNEHMATLRKLVAEIFEQERRNCRNPNKNSQKSLNLQKPVNIVNEPNHG